MKDDFNDKKASMKSCKKNKKKKKGFTLIELLAVIIILGVLMIIAIPSVTKYINDSRKNGYISTAKNIVTGVRNLIHSGNLDMTEADTTYYIEGKCIKTDNSFKSPYGEFEKAYVVVVPTKDGYDYYWMSVDDTGTGVKSLIKLNELDSEKIETDIDENDVSPIIGIDKRDKIIVVGGKDCTKGEKVDAEKIMNGTTGRVKPACPATYTPTIYWALQDTNSDGKNDKLVVSDSSVSGNISGNFPVTATFTAYSLPEWIGVSAQSDIMTPANLSYYVTDIEVVGQVAPTSVAFWFFGVGMDQQSFRADLNNLEMCHVTDMTGVLSGAGIMSSSVYIDIRDWDTSKVTSMEGAFNSTGSSAQTFKIDGLEILDTSNVTTMFAMLGQAGASASNLDLNLTKWNTSKVTDMSYLFSNFGQNSQSVKINLSGWDTSNVTNFEHTFAYAGKAATTLNIIGYENFNTSKVTNMDGVFYYTWYSTPSVNINLTSWDTKNVTNMLHMFGYVGYKASSVNININNWNTSKVTNMKDMFNSVGNQASTLNIDVSGFNTKEVVGMAGMFVNVGPNAENFSVTIPRTNGNGIDNSASRMYGSTTSSYGVLPSGKSFTLVFAN